MNVTKLQRDVIESLREFGIPDDCIEVDGIERWRSGEIKRIILNVTELIPRKLLLKVFKNLYNDLKLRGYQVLGNTLHLLENCWVIALGIMKRKGDIIEILIYVKTRS